MKVIGVLLWLILTLCQAQAERLDLSKVKTAIDMSQYEPGTVIVSNSERRLFYKAQSGEVFAYSVAVGKKGMSWSGTVTIAQIKMWPDWTPPPEMLKRNPSLPRSMAGGPGNPLGSRALYLYSGNKDTQYRIHGSSSPDSIGYATSSGCFRMFNQDVEKLADMVQVGTKVVVLE